MEPCINYLFLGSLWNAARRPGGHNCFLWPPQPLLLPLSEIFYRIVKWSTEVGTPRMMLGRRRLTTGVLDSGRDVYRNPVKVSDEMTGAVNKVRVRGIQTMGTPWDTDPLNHWLVISFTHSPYKLKDTTCDELSPQKLDKKYQLRSSDWLWT